MRKTKPLKRITISVDDSDYKIFEEIAGFKSCSVSYLIRQAMKMCIQKLKQQQGEKDAESNNFE